MLIECSDGIRKSKAPLELDLARDAKKNTKGFYRYINQKGKVQEVRFSLVSNADRLVTKRRMTYSTVFFTSVFDDNCSPLSTQMNRLEGGD